MKGMSWQRATNCIHSSITWLTPTVRYSSITWLTPTVRWLLHFIEGESA